MATRRITKKSELATAGAHLGAAAKEVGTAVSHKIDALGDAVSASMGRAKKNVMKQGAQVQAKIGGLVKSAEKQLAKAQAQLSKAGAAAEKSVKAAEKRLEATKRSTARQLAALQAGAERKAKALQRACLLYTSPSPRDRTRSRMPSSA